MQNAIWCANWRAELILVNIVDLVAEYLQVVFGLPFFVGGRTIGDEK